MAAGAGGSSGGSFESTVDRKFMSVTNTQDSIQGLSAWCIANKNYHSVIVRHWLKCLKRCDSRHKLNLFFLANDVIQNCKRKNAIVYLTAFADVLPEALVQLSYKGDAAVIKSVDRILSIWNERSVYSGSLIAELRNKFSKAESSPETGVEQKTPLELKDDLRSKVVAEFVPQALVDKLSSHIRTMQEVELKERHLASMRIDICSTEGLKKLKDKAGGKKFSKDFEEGSSLLREFVTFFDKQNKTGPALLEALSHADIFYEMQYKEVKIVANAYQTFANRVTVLKRKLDALKATLPDFDESPIPSPSMDAPSPTGSESPFHNLGDDKPAMDMSPDEAYDEAPAVSPLSILGGSPPPVGQTDNREVEDMDLSDVEMDDKGAMFEEHASVPSPAPDRTEPPAPNAQSTAPTIAHAVTHASSVPPAASAPAAALYTNPAAAVPQAAQYATPAPVAALAPVTTPTPAAKDLDFGKIGSILNIINSVTPKMPVDNSPAVAVGANINETSAPAAAPREQKPAVKPFFPKVDMSPADLLSALSKIQGKGIQDAISSLLSCPPTHIPPLSNSSGKTPSPSSTPTPQQSHPSVPTSVPHLASQNNPATNLAEVVQRDRDLMTKPQMSSFQAKASTLNETASNFQYNSPALEGIQTRDTQSGTPVRDEGGGTPTQDETLDKPMGKAVSSAAEESAGSTLFQSNMQQNAYLPQQQQPQNGQLYQSFQYSQPAAAAAPLNPYYQANSAPSGGPVTGESSSYGSTTPSQGTQRGGPWHGGTFTEGRFQQGYNPTVGGAGENQGYNAEQAQQVQQRASSVFGSVLPPVPQMPPPGIFGFNPNEMKVPELPPAPNACIEEPDRTRGEGGADFQDHEHRPMLPREQLPYDGPVHQQDNPRGYEEDMQYHDQEYLDNDYYQDGQYANDPYEPPPRPPNPAFRARMRLPPPHPDDMYHPQGHHRPRPPLRYPPGMPGPDLGMHRPRTRPPMRPPHLAHRPHPRVHPYAPRFEGPGPRLRGPYPGPRGGRGMGPLRPFKPLPY
ncbi:regulation of nuclear pre-mRNA domain-containing protein 2a [Synchiropus splendidus]|uniref:regulation of nuclear pre-mRNA domain-containing protein 2a n=1 Tax=Synchiropus splendidus TaxID=270530 RepID=UPI00237D3C37|nr:regulation of nuclear pre-mRNA domain-containing protein 2a [Synchiropus splendidus]